jgi:hypothetical protein
VILIYEPEGATPREWDFEPDKLMTAEVEAIERQTGWTYVEFGQQLGKGSVTAKRALLWVLLKRNEPTLRHAQVDVPAGAIRLKFSRAELEETRAALLDGRGDYTDAQREQQLQAIAEDLASRPEAVDVPKAPSPDDDSSG